MGPPCVEGYQVTEIHVEKAGSEDFRSHLFLATALT
ncbi:hypothetical protein PP1Y_AT141 [Novosphingobium sp. PP1Y]|nr:hypothetical protein PP1Y_AT141 [Novosphingobium sp. PP1Y]